MLFFLISCLSFLLLSKSLALKSIQSCVNEMILLTALFWRELTGLFVQLRSGSHYSASVQSRISSAMSFKKKILSKVENVEEDVNSSILDLPELALECILEKLPPTGLCTMAGVCRSLRDRCRSDHLWERHLKNKWGSVVGHAAYREWKWFIASRKDSGASEGDQSKGWIASLPCVWPVSWFRLKMDSSSSKPRIRFPVNSIMSWYLSLESGKFWFPAQVYYREHGHVGFMLSCYDADLSYDSHTDTFHARYPPHGRRTMAIEEGVKWERLRAPPVETPAHELHISNCLNDLRPGDHIEIQWRRNKEFPYGWWYGVVGHLESCDENEHLCHCHNSDTVMLNFNHHTPGSRWRQTTVNRKHHGEEGNETDGFYGGIRKFHKKEEIAVWKWLWPTEVLEKACSSLLNIS